MELFDSVQYLKGVGPARAKLLAKLGIETIYDLLTYYPRSYEDRSQLCPICEMEVGKPACFSAMVIQRTRTGFTRQWAGGGKNRCGRSYRTAGFNIF